jgi:hypothetical protein
LTDPLVVAILLPLLVGGGGSMKKRSLLVKVIAIVNAVLITTAFVGCPARKDPSIVTIAPPPPADVLDVRNGAPPRLSLQAVSGPGDQGERDCC